MNEKKVKKLRKVAQLLSVGKQMVQYEERALNPRRPTHRTRFMYDCTRLVYKNLKRSNNVEEILKSMVATDG